MVILLFLAPVANISYDNDAILVMEYYFIAWKIHMLYPAKTLKAGMPTDSFRTIPAEGSAGKFAYVVENLQRYF